MTATKSSPSILSEEEANQKGEIQNLLSEWGAQFSNGCSFPLSIAEQRMILSHIYKQDEQIKKLESDLGIAREAIEKEMPTEHLVLCDVNEFANADISGCVCPIKTFRQALSRISFNK